MKLKFSRYVTDYDLIRDYVRVIPGSLLLMISRKNIEKPVLLLLLVPYLLTGITGCSKSEELVFYPKKEHYVERNIEYGINADTSSNIQHLLLDIYYPSSADDTLKYPLVLMIHGGSYLNGTKEWVAPSCEILADSGFIVANIDYRQGWRSCSGGEFTLEEAFYKGMQDANAALRFLISNASSYRIDTNWVFIAGESAGAAIALNCSFINEEVSEKVYPLLAQKLGGLHNSGNEIKQTYTIKGICTKWGSISDTTLPARSKEIPVIGFHGTEDSLVPADRGYFLGCTKLPAFGTLCIYRVLLSNNITCVAHLKTGADHLPDDYTPEFTMSKTAVFFHQIMENRAKSALFIE